MILILVQKPRSSRETRNLLWFGGNLFGSLCLFRGIPSSFGWSFEMQLSQRRGCVDGVTQGGLIVCSSMDGRKVVIICSSIAALVE